MKSYATAMLLVASSTTAAVKLVVNGEVSESKLSAKNHATSSSKLAQTKDWDNEMAGLMDVNGYMKPTESSLADQDLHNTEKYSMSIDKYEQLQKKIKQKEEAESQIRKEQTEMMEKEKKVQEETIKEAQQALKGEAMKGKTNDEKKQIIAQKIAEKATSLVEGSEKKEKTEKKAEQKVENKETKKNEQKEAKKTEDKKDKKVEQNKEAPKSLAQATNTEGKKVEEKPKAAETKAPVAAPQVEQSHELTEEETRKSANDAFAQAAASLDLENGPIVKPQNLPQVAQKSEEKSKSGSIAGFFPGSTVDLNAVQREVKETHEHNMKDALANQVDAESMANNAQNTTYSAMQKEEAKKQSLVQSESQIKLEQQLGQMKENIDSFCQTLNKEKIKEAIRIHQDLKKQGVPDIKNKFEVNLVERMQKGFEQFPEMVDYEYSQNQFNYLQAAQENFGTNYTDDKLLDYMVNRAEEVGRNLKEKFADFFRNPLNK